MKLLAIDGNSIINRAFYGVRPLSTKEGIPTNAIYGFLTILQKLLAETTPDCVAVAFDLKAPTFRHKRYEGYKAQRKGMPDELAQQLPLLKELLVALGYRIVSLEGFEADDILGTLATGCCQSGNACVIATGDRDSFQLIDDCVSVRLASTQRGQPVAELCDVPYINERYGVMPTQLIDVKALMGDSSDNVPGVAGVGEKTALSLIQTYGNLDAIYEKLEELELRPALREKLKNGKEMAFLSRELVTIDRAVPVDSDPALYRIGEIQMSDAYALLANLEMFSLMERLGVHAPQDAPAEEATAPAPAFSAELNPSLSTLESLLAKGSRTDMLVQWQGEDPAEVAVILPERLLLFRQDAQNALDMLLKSDTEKRTNHTKLFYRYGLRHNVEVHGLVFDLEIAGYILSPTSTDYSMERLAAEYQVVTSGTEALFEELKAFEEEAPPTLADAKKKKTDDPEDALRQKAQQFLLFAPLSDALTHLMEENEQMHLFTDIELPLAQVLAEMEHAGFAIDTAGLIEYGQRLDVEIIRYQTEIYTLAGEEFNINSPKQLGVILFEKLGLPAGKKTKTGYSTNADVLDSLLGKHPIIQNILEYRKVAKLKSTYVDGLLKVVGDDGRIHTSFQQTLTRTGRISSTEPNMQNIPIRTPLGSELRRFFGAKPGHVLADADYSQIELRVLAHIADDENMLEAFRHGEDIHTNTAAQVFDMPPLFVTPLMRSRAKAVNFGIVYGIGAFSLSQDIGVTVAEANQYIKGYLKTYGGVKQYMEDTIAFGTEHGYVKTLLGRRRYLPELASSNRITKEFGKRVAMNTPIQGTAADIIKIAMVKVFRRLRTEGLCARLILQVHDELIVECPETELQHAKKILQEEMESAVALKIPLEVDVGSGNNWLNAK